MVHIDHGIGRYEGLKTLEVQEAPHDCLELHYGGDSKLYLPVENIDLLTRYGSDERGRAARPAGRRGLAGAQGQGQGAAARDGRGPDRHRRRPPAEDHAEEIDPPHGLFDEFCARFPYEETDDQLNAIADVLGDLAAGRPMDRLICGDVGFGKTEVALRAAFVDGHERPAGGGGLPDHAAGAPALHDLHRALPGLAGARSRRLSRLVPAAEADADPRGAEEGRDRDRRRHPRGAVRSRSAFKDLGLVIVDEEQHFGVKHKEALKALRAEVHVLTLTATPIPRTLQMALSGIREMSIIATPPVDRLAVRTYITPYDPVVDRARRCCARSTAAARPISSPRASRTCPSSSKFLREQVPEVKFVVGHGQMAPTQLEDVMSAFYDGRYDVLLSTTHRRSRASTSRPPTP